MKQNGTPLVIEMVGPAGAGKSTFTQTLIETVQNVQVIEQPDYRQFSNLPFFLWNALLMLPVFFNVATHAKRGLLERTEIGMMIILNGWHRRLKRQHRTETLQAFFIDQGAVSFLSYLAYHGAWIGECRLAKKWWGEVYHAWANTINVVMLMDAPNEVLSERIRSREQEHDLQKASFEKVVQVLDDYRALYENIFTRLQAESAQVKVFRFNSVGTTKEKLHSDIIAIINQVIYH